ncbi:hypothetical protein N9P88_02560 [Planctomycetota bacterium]|nr:hypothetical protein [Planctomycetota bacterium]|tara:strand:+ start:318 stop:908 length:591 start_codon:yes stop_codon:yes gene_type:complete
MDKRKAFWTMWAVIPVLVAIWWFGPGQELQARTRLSSIIDEARTCIEAEDWEKAVELYQQAIGDVPSDDEQALLWLRLQTSHAEFMSGDTWAGISSMEEVMNEAGQSQPELAREARAKIAAAQYFATWKLRLEGAEPDVWKPEAEKARQHFRLLAEDAESNNLAGAADLKKNVESVIWLEQMDLAELKALPLPGGC